jgi:hypothetical protein
MTYPLSGGCACGHVRYELLDTPMFVQCCHCLDCQRQTGGPFVINAIIEADRMRTTGFDPVSVPVPAPSGEPHIVFRCPICQVAVWSDYGSKGWRRFVRVGTLDDPTALRPQAHVFTRSKQPWITLSPDIPAFDIYYEDDLWPAASMERLRRGFARASAPQAPKEGVGAISAPQ